MSCGCVILDIDECKNSTTNDCQQECINTPGSYACSCKSGYLLNDNNQTCEGIAPIF